MAHLPIALPSHPIRVNALELSNPLASCNEPLRAGNSNYARLVREFRAIRCVTSNGLPSYISLK